jgi:ketosteroid isomerase-like protein
MTDPDHRQILGGFADVVRTHDWDHLGDYIAQDAVWDYPQSGERFRGLSNIRAQLEEVIGGTSYALTPTYTLVAVDGSGDRGTAVVRVRYPDGSRWWAVNLYRLRDGKVTRTRVFFAPEFEPPDWRAPYREPETPVTPTD